MNELNRDQVIKALECCRYGGRCAECPCFEIPNCQAIVNENAIALIKELTEENERLHASCAELAQECKKWQHRMNIECEYTKANTVREMQDLINGILEFDIVLTDDETKYLCERIDQIAKEMAEGEYAKSDR